MTVGGHTSIPATVAEAAAAFTALGWRVVPVLPGSKRPAIGDWVTRASSDLADVHNWWTDDTNDNGYGVGVVGGDGLVVIDIDGEAGLESLDRLEAEHGRLPDTVTVYTPGGGIHFYYRIPRSLRTVTNRSVLGAGIDVRGDGGFVVAPPSRHPNGGRYVYADDKDPWTRSPEWLTGAWLRLVTRPAEPDPPPKPPPVDGDDDLDGHTRTVYGDFQTVLIGDGWAVHHTDGATVYLTRPHKDLRDGWSAALHNDTVLVVWSTNAPAELLTVDRLGTTGDTWTHTLFTYITATRHNGDPSAAARHIRRETGTFTDHRDRVRDTLNPDTDTDGAGSADGEDGGDGADDPLPDLDWDQLWSAEVIDRDWLCEPLVPAGRQVSLYSLAKAGKSLLALEVAAGIATGRPVLLRPAGNPVHVLYVDMEQTEGDLRERLENFGYEPDDNLENLHYLLLPPLDPLDTRTGGDMLVTKAVAVGAVLVVIDTMARVVDGPESEADTYRAFYRHTGTGLKRHGIALLRLDHAGKDPTKGARGSSSKDDDVDVIARLTADGDEITISAPRSRISWFPNRVRMRKTEDPDGVVRHVVTVDPSTMFASDAVRRCADRLDELEVPLSATRRDASETLRQAGWSGRNRVVSDALRWRRYRPPGAPNSPDSRRPQAGTTPGTTLWDHAAGAAGDQESETYRDQEKQAGTTAGTTGDHGAAVSGDHGPPLRGDQDHTGPGPTTSETPDTSGVDDAAARLVADLVHQYPGKTRNTIRALVVGVEQHDTLDAIDRAVRAGLIHRAPDHRLWPPSISSKKGKPDE